MNCTVCTDALRFQWTDTHGVGVCISCGTPYTIYHYENDQRVDQDPEIALSDYGVEIAKKYWADKQRRVFPGSYDMGFFGRAGRNGRTYSGATVDDVDEFNEWYEAHYPKSKPCDSESSEATEPVGR
jgi:hypothetical protein